VQETKKEERGLRTGFLFVGWICYGTLCVNFFPEMNSWQFRQRKNNTLIKPSCRLIVQNGCQVALKLVKSKTMPTFEVKRTSCSYIGQG
jgi:hypothetical protein